ncbi:MAG TPA: hypothetical protein VGC56_05925 [Allosphingosinicella sp.]|jgi:hypothetical protein
MASFEEMTNGREGVITFAATFASLFAAGGATRLVTAEPMPFVSTLLFFLLVLAYATLTGPGRRAGLPDFVASALGVPTLFTFLLLPLGLLSPGAADLLLLCARVGLPMWTGGPDGYLPVVALFWGVSVAIPFFAAILAQSFLLPAIEEFIERRRAR